MLLDASLMLETQVAVTSKGFFHILLYSPINHTKFLPVTDFTHSLTPPHPEREGERDGPD